jgi:hypothetical protein
VVGSSFVLNPLLVGLLNLDESYICKQTSPYHTHPTLGDQAGRQGGGGGPCRFSSLQKLESMHTRTKKQEERDDNITQKE